MAANGSPSDMDCTCPVCCDIFKDPVVLLCGHSFCKYCLQEWWKQSRLQSCPVCKELFPMAQPPRNLALRNLSDALRREKSLRAPSGAKELCSLHSEKLKLFCEDDQQLICVICRDAKNHKKHNCIPLNEAAEDHRTEVRIGLMHLKRKLGSFEREKLICDNMASHIKLQAQKTEKTIKAEFQKLYQFLRAEEAVRIDALRKEVAVKTDTMSIRIASLTAEMVSLRDSIKTINEETKAEDVSFMLNVKSTLKRSQCNLPEPETPSGALIDEAKHLGNLLYTVWGKMKNIIQYTPVTLDPNTSSTSLILSDNLTQFSEGEKAQRLPNNPEREDSSSVLGYERFSSGKHSWVVEVRDYWDVGVAVKTKGSKTLDFIGISKCMRTLHLYGNGLSDYITCDLLSDKVKVQLDYDQGMLSFFDFDRGTNVHTIKYTFTEPVVPYFRDNAKILPAQLSVILKHP